MDTLQAFKDIAPYLTHPLVLVGFVLLLFFGVHRTLIKAGIIPPLDQQTGSAVVQRLLRYGFVIALVVIVLGFGLQLLQGDQHTGGTEFSEHAGSVENPSQEP